MYNVQSRPLRPREQAQTKWSGIKVCAAGQWNWSRTRVEQAHATLRRGSRAEIEVRALGRGYRVKTVSPKMVTTRLLIVALILCATASCQKAYKHQGLTADQWRGVFSCKANIMDFPEAQTNCLAGDFNEAPWRVFCQKGPLSRDSIYVLRDLLENDGDPQNRRLRLCVLECIKEHKGSSRPLVPSVARRLTSGYTCEKLSAISTLCGLGTEAEAATNALSRSLSDSNAYVRVHAALALSTFGRSSRAYLPAIEDIVKGETNPKHRSLLEQAVSRIKCGAQSNGGEGRR